MSNPTPRFVLYNHPTGFTKFDEDFVGELKRRGFGVIETNDSKVAVSTLEGRKDIGFVVTSEEGLRLSGTSLIRLLESRGLNVPTAVLADKDIPTYRVPVSFRRPVVVTTLAQFVADSFAFVSAGKKSA